MRREEEACIRGIVVVAREACFACGQAGWLAGWLHQNLEEKELDNFVDSQLVRAICLSEK